MGLHARGRWYGHRPSFQERIYTPACRWPHGKPVLGGPDPGQLGGCASGQFSSRQSTGQPTNSIIRPSILAEHNLFQWLWHFLENSSKERILHNSEGMRQMGAAIAPLVEEMFADLGLDRTWHNFHYTPGLLLSRYRKTRLSMILFSLHLLSGWPIQRRLLQQNKNYLIRFSLIVSLLV